MTWSHIGDAGVLPELPGQILADHDIGSVTAGGACGTRKCHDAIADRGAPAVIPPRKNAKTCRGRHRRGHVAIRMHRVTRLGQRRMARELARQVAKIQRRSAVPNGHPPLGIRRGSCGVSPSAGRRTTDISQFCNSARHRLLFGSLCKPGIQRRTGPIQP